MAGTKDAHDKGDLLGILRRDIDDVKGSGTPGGSRSTPIPGDEATRAARHAALAAVYPLPVPCLAISLPGRTAAEVGRMLRTLPAQMDPIVARYPVKLEARLDMLTGFSERINALALVLQLGVPVIITLRSKTEGGAAAQTDHERQGFLLTALNALKGNAPRGSLLDIEASAMAADPDGWAQVVHAAKERGFELLLSHHDLSVSPEGAQRLLPPPGLLETTPGGGALVWKSATAARTWEQELALIRAARRGNLVERSAAIMSIDDPIVRLIAPFLGIPMVYAAPDADHGAARGQLPFRDLVHAWARWGVRPDDAALARTLTESEPDDPQADAKPRDRDRRIARRIAPRFALLGRPAWHSLSPAMHNAAARALALDHRYFPLEIPEHTGSGTQADVLRHTLETLRDVGVVGGNVTVPFKEIAYELMDEVDAEAQAIGAVNTFRFEGTKVVGSNTDAHGIRDVLADRGIDLATATVLVLGAGGSAKAAAHAARDAQRVLATNRTPARAQRLADDLDIPIEVRPWEERLAAAQEADLVIHCTTIGMAGTQHAELDVLDGMSWRADQTVVDLVYATSDAHTDDGAATGALLATPLLRAAQAGGAQVIDGLDVLVAQGARAFRSWTDTEPSPSLMREAAIQASQIPLQSRVRDAYQRAEVIA